MKELESVQYGQVSGPGMGDTCGGENSGNCGGSSGSSGNNGGHVSYRDKSYPTSNRRSGSQANHFGNGGAGFGSSGGCTAGSIGNYR